MEPLGPKIRRQRLRLGFTLQELARLAGISKPYLSLIETGRVPNPPSDEKVRRLEQVLGFSAGELLTQAHLQRTPRDVRAALQSLLSAGTAVPAANGAAAPQNHAEKESRGQSALSTSSGQALACKSKAASGTEVDLSAFRSFMARPEIQAQRIMDNPVPVINRSSGYPKDFTDGRRALGDAEGYVSCPDVCDPQAFAARVHGDSMTPKYREGDIVIFSPASTPRDGDDCFVRFGDGRTTFQRIFFETAAGAPVLRLQPRNERYRPQTVPSIEVRLFKAVYRYQKVDDASSH